MRTSCPAPGTARTCSVIILYQSEDQQELLATGDDLSYSIWALWGYEVVSGKSGSLVENVVFVIFQNSPDPKSDSKTLNKLSFSNTDLTGIVHSLLRHRLRIRVTKQIMLIGLQQPIKERKGSLTLTFPSITTVSPLSTTLLTQPLTFIPANGVHCALE